MDKTKNFQGSHRPSEKKKQQQQVKSDHRIVSQSDIIRYMCIVLCSCATNKNSLSLSSLSLSRRLTLTILSENEKNVCWSDSSESNEPSTKLLFSRSDSVEALRSSIKSDAKIITRKNREKSWEKTDNQRRRNEIKSLKKSRIHDNVTVKS